MDRGGWRKQMMETAPNTMQPPAGEALEWRFCFSQLVY